MLWAHRLSLLPLVLLQGRPRLSIRRRPPSRRYRKSSSGDEVGVANEGGDPSPNSPTEPEDKTREGDGGGEKEGRGEDQTDERKDDKTGEGKDDKTGEVKDDKTGEGKDDKTGEVKDDKTNPSSCPEKNKSEEDHSETSVEPRQEVEKKNEEENGPEGGPAEDPSPAGEKEEKKNPEDVTEGATNTDVTEEEKAEVTTQKLQIYSARGQKHQSVSGLTVFFLHRRRRVRVQSDESSDEQPSRSAAAVLSPWGSGRETLQQRGLKEEARVSLDSERTDATTLWAAACPHRLFSLEAKKQTETLFSFQFVL